MTLRYRFCSDKRLLATLTRCHRNHLQPTRAVFEPSAEESRLPVARKDEASDLFKIAGLNATSNELLVSFPCLKVGFDFAIRLGQTSDHISHNHGIIKPNHAFLAVWRERQPDQVMPLDRLIAGRQNTRLALHEVEQVNVSW